ncbi:hypothetical protein M514_20484 [Trichuris suis]|uniref:HTH CENPB-type domain-containing protein n=1 Tax=Trichuris suis TaxID=68888 RepID=A0A085NDA2_9BILA|nr:hypothetical protein M514_20484 [Trichuris suis]
MSQARRYHDELKIQGSCAYSIGWYQKFQRRNGIKTVKIRGDRGSADHEAAKEFVEEFARIIADEKLSPEQVYNADETSLFWRYCPRRTVTTSDEIAPTGVKDTKERIGVLACGNAASTHKCKLAAVGKNLHPRCFKSLHSLPIHYYANKKAWFTRDIFSQWFQKHFVPAARAHCREVGLQNGCKILLLLDNCPAHPPAEILSKNSVYAMCFPPNVTSLIQPCDQGILRSMKSKYKNTFLNCMLSAVDNGVNVERFRKQFSMKDAVYAVANAWDAVTKKTITGAWHNLWPAPNRHDLGEQRDNTEDLSEEKMTADLLRYANCLPSESISKLEEVDIEEVFNIDNCWSMSLDNV